MFSLSKMANRKGRCEGRDFKKNRNYGVFLCAKGEIGLKSTK
jgi:hypothetical protein